MTVGLVCGPMSSPLGTISDVIPDDDNCPTAATNGGGDPPAGSDEGDTTTLPRSS